MLSPFARSISLSTRVLLFVALAVAASTVIFGQLAQRAVEHHFAEQDAAEMQVMARAVERVTRNAGDTPNALRNSLPRAVSGHHDAYFRVYDANANLLYSSLSGVWSDPPQCIEVGQPLDLSRLHVWSAGDRTYRSAGFCYESNGRRYRVVTAININFHLEFLRRFRLSMWVILAVAGATTMLAAWIGVHQGHAPLRKLANRIKEIETDRLHMRIDPATMPEDLRSLVTSFNDMIGRLEEEFTRLSNISDDIAHELRTPLTNLITQTQVALSRPRDDEQYRETLHSSLEEYERLADMVNKMLWLAKSEHGLVRPVLSEIELGLEVRKVVEYFEALAEERGVRLRIEAEQCMVRGDRELLRRAISNLVSNALSHTPAQREICIRFSAREGNITLAVENEGPDIPPEHLPRLFDRFYRVDSARRDGDGAGLGLAIVRKIAELHDGSVDARSANGMTTFRFTLPAYA